MNNLIEDANNKINYFIELKSKIKGNKITYTSCAHYQDTTSGYFDSRYYDTYMRIIIKKLKYLKQFYFMPTVLKKIKKNKKQCHINNLVVDHLKVEFNFYYYNEDYRISMNPLVQLTMIIYFLKFMNIKKITFEIAIIKRLCPMYNPFCESLRNVIQKYCKNIRVAINYRNSTDCFITKLGSGVNIIKEDYATINKFKINYHRNYQLKNRVG